MALEAVAVAHAEGAIGHNINIQQNDDLQVLIHPLLAIYITSNTAPTKRQTPAIIACLDFKFQKSKYANWCSSPCI
jgi:hypothetical protein